VNPIQLMEVADLIDKLDASYDTVVEFIDEHGAGSKGEAVAVLDAIESAADYLYRLRYANGE
jgi:hypothetical protein